ncbi:hypothetical protein N0V94_000521 [Neodidymelliopsis sp. IMI 364377]|nr:hypothetical protein N0V94_000521 [Neodidymelliopsis sp. IMI 364377]
MVLIASLISILLSIAALVLSAPVADVDTTPLNFPAGSLTAMLDARAVSTTCPGTGTSCGVITFNGGQYVSFGRGICMQIAGKIQSIYVAHCYCSLWKKDVYVDGMMLCEKSRMMDEFPKKVNYISCG